MVTEVTSLGLAVDSRQVVAANQQLARFSAAGQQAERSATGFERSAATLGLTLNRVVGALGVAQVVKYADAFQQVNARLRLVTNGQAAFNRVQGELVALANETRVGLTETIDLYGRIARSTKALAASDTDRLRVTEAINKALIVSGASGVSAQAALIQLGQGLASGTLRGEELNSVLEQTPRLAEAIARGIGKNVGELRKFAAEGKLTSQAVFEALLSQADALDAEFSRIPMTIGQAIQVAENNLQQFIGGTSEASGAGRALASVIVALSKNMDLLAAAGAGFATLKLAELLVGIGSAAKANVATFVASASALQAQRAASVASAQAEAQRTSAVAATAAAERSAASSRLAGIQTTQAAIVAARAETTERLRATQATLAQAAAQLQAAKAAGALSFAIAQRNAAEAAQAAALARQSALVKDLAILGQQQANVQKSAAAATAALATAQTAAATAATAQATAQKGLATAVAASSSAMGVASRLLGFLGGPIGAITTALSLGATAWVLWGNKAEQSADQASEALKRTLSTTILASQSQIQTLNRQIQSSLDAGFAADSSRVRALQARRDALQVEVDKARDERVKIDRERQRNDSIARNEIARRVDPQAIRNRQQEALAEFLKDNATDVEKFQAAVKKAKEELGDLFTPELEARLRAKFLKPKAGDKPDILGFDLNEIRNRLNGLTSAYQNAEQILDAQRSAALISEQEYFDAKLGFIRLNSEAQVASLQAENKRLAAVKGSRKEELDALEKIAQNEAQIAIIRAQSAAAQTVLGIQSQAAADATVRGLLEARAAAEDYLASLKRAQDIEIAGAGLGTQARDRLRARAAIEERYLEQRQQLAAERRQNQITEERYRQELAIIAEFQAKALALEEEGHKARLANQRDFNKATLEAVQNYIDAAGNVSERIEGFFSGAFKAAEDDLAKFIQTGKFSLKGFGDFIAAELSRATARSVLAEGLGFLREQVQSGAGGGLVGAIGQSLGTIFGGGAGGGLTVPGFAGGQISVSGAAKAAGDAAATAATTARTAAETAATATITARTASETAATAAISAAATSSAAALGALTLAAQTAASALASVGASSAASSAGGGVLDAFKATFDGFRAIGGPAGAGQLLKVNERGLPELLTVGAEQFLLMGAAPGTVTPLRSGGGAPTVNNFNYAFTEPASRRTQEQVAVASARGLGAAQRRRVAG